MSINKIYTNKDRIENHKYNFILDFFRSSLNGNYSVEEKIFVEGQVLDFIDAIETLEYKELTEFDRFFDKDIVMTENLIKHSLGVSQIQSSDLSRNFLTNFNESKIMLESIVGKIKRIRQKQAALDIWNNDYSFPYSSRPNTSY